MLEKKEKVLDKKAAAELERAKEFSKAKNKRGVHWIQEICAQLLCLSLLVLCHHIYMVVY
jgi:hypothetical protein